MAPKHSLDTPPGPSCTRKRERKTTPTILKRTHQANFDRLCALHNWTPSEAARDKFARLLHLSGKRLQASELLPLAFVQHYPFIWMNDLLLLGYDESDVSVWFRAYPTGRGIARGHYYNSLKVSIAGKNIITQYWQSWIGVFDIEQRGQDGMHEFFTGVYLILKDFPNLRYKTAQKGKQFARDPQNIIRTTGIAEYPFNDDHLFMQEESDGITDPNDYAPGDDDQGDRATKEQEDNNFSKQEKIVSHDDSERSTPLSSILSSPQESRAVPYEMITASSLPLSRHATNASTSTQNHQEQPNPPTHQSQSQHPHQMVSDPQVEPDEQAAPDESRLRARKNGRTSLLEQPSVRSITRAHRRSLVSNLVSLPYESVAAKQTGKNAKHDDEKVPYILPSKQPRSRIGFLASNATSSNHAAGDAREEAQKRGIDALHSQTPSAIHTDQPSFEQETDSQRPLPVEGWARARERRWMNGSLAHQTSERPPPRPSPRTSEISATTRVETTPNIQEIVAPESVLTTSSSAPQVKEYIARVPVEEPRWSTTDFNFAFATPVQTVPEGPTPAASPSNLGHPSLRTVDTVPAQPLEEVFKEEDSEDTEEEQMTEMADMEADWGDESIFSAAL
ncbi:hypothetical protein AUEXF2481DRAFT_26622 [Aureobasidium subglaciale EXF-2481]|uniref:Uncharacterized protein n=1 Tax=Aureobasidium subglaciale (strain EXF-2481) TaxID=1043005 RepID=A0A074YQ07_AURSE|nr:uncharacterized protein AUEXF2481DRAFT_26622 [Aureobasidium subglaciale EXF-2481]KAI5197539.1 hypothetical protein E4T38_07938 [Aureobasidium subglaciale]KAI5216452.1 hypothetical protein E4T40_07948 [Aureobasidium subglaciale]KAI5219625.1 hypothetical protein E4T41_07882 [Aureobasidium subglaciale]KAI5257655.1 hypothetical protein E4T46_07839 [Aureobasidium subglaciale]KEQ98234.1 hypothetical protein AUEXF2481DRAFT_26622 [Aureobasidium subglaciale EXF-2481]